MFLAEVGGESNLILLHNRNFKRVSCKIQLFILTYIILFSYLSKQGLEFESSVQSTSFYDLCLEAALGVYFMYRSTWKGKQLPFFQASSSYFPDK